MSAENYGNLSAGFIDLATMEGYCPGCALGSPFNYYGLDNAYGSHILERYCAGCAGGGYYNYYQLGNAYASHILRR